VPVLQLVNYRYTVVQLRPKHSLLHRNNIRELHACTTTSRSLSWLASTCRRRSIQSSTRYSITLTTDEPVHSKPYPLPHAMQETIDKELENILQMGIIEPSTSPYASPIVVVRKPDGSNRICVDYRKLNKITVFDPELMPQPEQIFLKLEKDRYFSTFDVTKGYWQIPMNSNDKATAVWVWRDRHTTRLAPFVLGNQDPVRQTGPASATYCRARRRRSAGLSPRTTAVRYLLQPGGRCHGRCHCSVGVMYTVLSVLLRVGA